MAKAKHHRPKDVRAATRKVMSDRAATPGGHTLPFLQNVEAELEKLGVSKVLPYVILAYLVAKAL